MQTVKTDIRVNLLSIICTLTSICAHLRRGANNRGQRRLLQPVGCAGGGAQELGRGGAEVGWSAELRGMAAGGGGRLHSVRQLLVEFLPGLVKLGQGGGAVEPSPKELRRWDGGT